MTAIMGIDEKLMFLISNTFLMLVNALMIVLYAVAIVRTKTDVKKRDIYYETRFNSIEKLMTDQFAKIINLLKNQG